MRQEKLIQRRIKNAHLIDEWGARDVGEIVKT